MNEFLNAFMETGAPEYYLLYRSMVKRKEEERVPEDEGADFAGNSVQ